MSIDLSKLLTERRNANSANIDTLSTLEMLTVINQEDQQVAQAITPYLPQIAEVVDKVAAALQAGGRLIYIGAGTSGRLGILDASECPPTFGTRPEQVVGIIAGGHKAILSAVENVEDNKAQGAMDLQNLNFSNRDVLVGWRPADARRTSLAPWNTPIVRMPLSPSSAVTRMAKWPSWRTWRSPR
ncbi:N-acetylmuramic acid 6-phosphate etherase [Klebsiella pneumoniae]|nr:N-acetylmuramic acid 6-phosphate etherase [Klebsiella pneumoniae]